MRTKIALAISLSLIAILLIAGIGIVTAAPAQKVDVCHLDEYGTFHLISISVNALPAHKAHGDLGPGQGVLDEECNVVQPTRYPKTLVFNSTGWAGQSCPLDEHAVGKGVLVGSANTYLWVSGATAGGFNYPYTPFGYTYATGETGMIIQNDGDGNETITYYVDCLPNNLVY